jgi:predicted TIM-barrel fold metal-dependent hydrolase
VESRSSPISGLSDKPNPEFFLGSMDALRRNYLAEDYLRDSCNHNVLTTVHVEAEMSRDNQIEETRWLSQVNENYGFPCPHRVMATTCSD